MKLYGGIPTPLASRCSVLLEATLKRSAILLATGIPLGLSGCIQVEAPDKPIVIELNMNIRQEVVYRIADEAEALIEEREDIF